MLNARIELRGEELFCLDTTGGGASTVRPLPPEALARLGRALRQGGDFARAPVLAEIGREIAGFLDEGDRLLDRILDGSTGEITLEVAVSGRPEERERVLRDVPWELLAPGGFFLAAHNERLFRVTRRLGRAAPPATPLYRDLALLFMAAEIDGQSILNYEQEESAILQATKGLDLNLMVEESGAIEFLTQRIAQDGPFEALHLSCHGDIENGEPVLALESPEGGLARAGIANLSAAFGEEGRKARNGLPVRLPHRRARAGRLGLCSVAGPVGCDAMGSVGTGPSMTTTRSPLRRFFTRSCRLATRSPMPRRKGDDRCSAPISPSRAAGGIGIWPGSMSGHKAAARCAPPGAPGARSAKIAAIENSSIPGNGGSRSHRQRSSSAAGGRLSASFGCFAIAKAPAS